MCKDYRPRCVQDRTAQRNMGRLQTHMGQVLNGENADVPTVVRGLPQTENKCKKKKRSNSGSQTYAAPLV